MKKILPIIAVLLISCTPKIKVLTFYVCSFGKFQENSIPDVAGIIKALDADVVSLNELDSCNNRHNSFQLKELSSVSGLSSLHFASAFPFAGGAYGNGILSKADIISSETVNLDAHGGYEPRSIAVIETKDYVLASTHLDVSKTGANVLQARDLNDWFALHYTGYDKPVLLCGDMNATPESPVIEELSHIWERVSPIENTYPSENAEKCIDYIFYLKTARSVELVKSKVVKEINGIDVAKASDHLPVYAELKVGPRRKSFNFISMTDTQVGFFDYNSGCMHSDSLFNAATIEINRIKPLLVVNTGDLIDAPWKEGWELQDSIYRANMAKIDPSIEVYEIPGNHDIPPFNEKNLQKYLELRGYVRFSVVRNDCAFIGIDSNCVKDGAEEAEAEQWDWLVGQLEAAKKCKHRFVFMHCPIIRHEIDEAEDYFNFPKSKRTKYIDMLKEHGVEAVFSGHTHMDNYAVYDGIQFINGGAIGNALARGYPGFWIVNVSDDDVIAEYVATPLPEGIGPVSIW